MSEPKGPLITVAFWLLGATAVCGVLIYIGALIFGMIAALPFGIFGLIPLAAIIILLFVVLRDQSTSKEDKYYSDNVDQ